MSRAALKVVYYATCGSVGFFAGDIARAGEIAVLGMGIVCIFVGLFAGRFAFR